jgi:hypothetical protein
MKRLTVTVLLILSLAFAVAAYAQEGSGSPLPEPTTEPTEQPDPEPPEEPVPPPEPDPIELPGTAAEALALLIAQFGIIGGAVTKWGTSWIRRLAFLPEEGKSKIAGGWAEFVAGLVALAVVVAQVFGEIGTQFLDENGLWAVIVFLVPKVIVVWVGSQFWHLWRKRARGNRNPGPLLGGMSKIRPAK